MEQRFSANTETGTDQNADFRTSEVIFNILKDKLGREPRLKDVPRIIMYMNEVRDELDAT